MKAEMVMPHRCHIPVFISRAHALLEIYGALGLGEYFERNDFIDAGLASETPYLLHEAKHAIVQLGGCPEILTGRETKISLTND